MNRKDLLKFTINVNLKKWSTLKYIRGIESISFIPTLILVYYLFGITWVFYALIAIEILGAFYHTVIINNYETKIKECAEDLNRIVILGD